MRVLTIAKDFPSPRHPDDGIFVLRQVQALAELGHQILVVRVVPHAPPLSGKWRDYRAVPERDVVEGIPVRTIRAFFAPRMIGLEYVAPQTDSAMRRLIAEFKPAVVHAHFLLPPGQMAARCRIPSLITAHGSDAYDWAWRRRGLHHAARRATARAGIVVAVSEFIARHVRALYEREVSVVYNGADERTFSPRDRHTARTALGIADDRFVIAFAGRITAAKGAFDLLRAVSRLRELRPIVLLAGSAKATQTGEAPALLRNVEARLLGTLKQADLARVFAAANVVALPSYHEGLPVVLCEAMLAGRPIVATPVGGIPEIVSDGKHGYLVAPSDVAALAERLAILGSDSAAAARMGAAAHAFAAETLTWRANAERYDALYRRLRRPSSNPIP